MMQKENSMLNEDWLRCVGFHGHVCPGLAIGCKAAQIALKELGEAEAEVDEGLVAIVQTDACGVDAVQVLTSCTFGKGNLLFQDYGKQVFTFLRRADGKGVRVALKYGVLQNIQDRQALIRNIVEGEPADFFNWRPVQIELPSAARINPTVQCAFCGEGVMEQRARVREGKPACPECAHFYESRVLALNK
jgi:formylmethanofuran dehydrogenase subunit E